MVRIGLRKPKKQEEDVESVDLNSISTDRRKNTSGAGAKAAAAAAKRAAAEPVDGPVVAGGPISPTSNTRAAGLLRMMKPKSAPPEYVASRDDFSMASGSTWTTKATEMHSTTQNMHMDAAGNPVEPHLPNYLGIDVRDDGEGGVGGNGGPRGSPLRRKFHKSALGGNKTDNTNISLVYSSHGPKASALLNLVLRENLPVPKLPTDVIVQVEVSDWAAYCLQCYVCEKEIVAYPPQLSFSCAPYFSHVAISMTSRPPL